MDKPRQKRNPIFKKLGWVFLAFAVVLGGIYFGFKTHSKSMYFPKDQIQISTIIKAPFSESISTIGTIIPSQTVQIDAFEGGVIEELFVDNGQSIQKGDPLLKLSNTALSLDFMNRETQIIEQINNLRNTRITLEQNKRNVQEQLVDISYELKQQEAQFKRDSNLYYEEVITQADYEASETYFLYLKNKKNILENRTETDEKYRLSQLGRIDESIHLMERNLEAVRNSLNQLKVLAPISGQLNSFQHEIGATLRKGEGIGRIDIVDTFHIQAKVDQYFLSQIHLGQTARLTLDGKTQMVETTKIFPTIQDNQFEIHFQFTQGQPINLRRGQNAPLKIQLSNAKESIVIPKGNFYASSGGKYVFVVKDNEAIKTPVTLGRQNDQHIEIKSGLQPGDQVITSSYTNFKDNDLILIQ